MFSHSISDKRSPGYKETERAIRIKNYIENEVRAILQSGTILKGRYCILEVLQRGGQGQLYLARDLEIGVLWAVKEIPRRQKREAKLLRLLKHPSLPTMVDYLEREEYCYLVMEYIQGDSLADSLRQGIGFPAEEVIRMGMDISRVLAYLHGNTPPIYYGDLKPENLMLTKEKNLYLVDLGSAVFAYDDRTRSCVGTRGYAAPEQYEGKIGKESDVYALGKTMFALLEKHPLKIWKNPGLLWVIFRCCQRNPSLRYQDMDAVEKKLKALHSSQKRIHRIFLESLIFAAVGFLAAGVWKGMSGTDFEEALTQVTEVCYGEEFLSGSQDAQKEILDQVEAELQSLLGQYGGKEQTRRLLLMLALNEELGKEYKRAALYYEQLLLYDERYRSAYGEYGCYLWRIGQQEAAERLEDTYAALDAQGILDDTQNPNLIWFCKKLDQDSRISAIPRQYKSFGMGGFDLQVGVGEEEWELEEEGSGEDASQNEADRAGEPEGEVSNEPNVEQNDSINNSTNNSTDNSTNNSTNSGSDDNRIQNSNQDSNNNRTSDSGHSTDSGIQNRFLEGSDDDPNQNSENDFNRTSNPVVLESGTNDGLIQETDSGSSTIERTENTNSDEKSSFSPEQTYDYLRYTISGAMITEYLLSLEKGESVKESDTGAQTEDAGTQEENPEKLMETLVPSYYSDRIWSNANLVIEKRSLETKKKGKLRIQMDADGPVHIFSMRLNGKECMWFFEDDAILLSDEADESENCITCLLIYEEKISVPKLVLS